MPVRVADMSKSSLQKMSPPNSSEQAQASQSSVELTGKRVVVCEDEGITLMQLKRMLTREGLQVVDVADNGDAAVEAVLRERPDLVIMDIRMPGIDGLQAAQRILQTYSVCIVMLTAFSDETFQRQAADIGTCGYVVKPITKESLLPELQAAFEKFHQPS